MMTLTPELHLKQPAVHSIGTLYQRNIKESMSGHKQFSYTEDGQEVIVKLSEITPRTPEMMYGERAV